MSVAPLTAQELACFAAICHKQLKAGPLSDLCQLAALASSGNAGAFSSQYGDPMEPSSAEEIEAIALEYMGDRRDMAADHFGPLAYNMIDNAGLAFIAPGVQTTQRADTLETLRDLEKRAQKWQDAQRRQADRAEQNAVAYNDIGQLQTLTGAEIEARMKAAGAQRVIFATFRVDETDTQSDYWGGRTSRTVVIGFGKGKRESFAQLRKAAGQFPPTAHMGPGKDIYRPRVVLTDDVISNGTAYWHGTYSHWHKDMEEGASFATEREALEFVAAKGTPEDIWFDGDKQVHFQWQIDHSSYEQRENYSMGGGNYLGECRYGGWQVKSSVYPGTDRLEFWEPKK